MQSFAGLARKAGLRASDLEATENPREVQVQKLLSEYQAAVAALASCENGEKEGIKDLFVNVLQLCEDLGYEDDLQVGRARLLCIKNLALLEEEDGEFRSAIEYLVEGLRVDPSDAVSALRLARLALTHFGNVRLARGALEAALRADPHFWPALTLLMEMLYSLGDDLGCLEAASRCLAEQPYFVRALEIRASVLVRNGAVGRAHECKFEGMSKVPEKSLEIVQPRARGDVAEVRAPLNVRVSILSWPHVTSQIVAKLKVCGFLSLAVSWAEARVPVVGNSGAAVVVVEDSNPPPEESTTNVASPAKQIVLRNEIEQQQQADFRKMLEEMFPWSSVLRKGGEVIADHAPDASSGSVLAAQAEDVRSWLSKLEDKMEPVHLLNELCEELFSRVKDPWDSLLQRSGNALGRIVLLWDVRPREYFLGLAELAVDACNAAPSVRSSTASSLVMVKKLLERFCFEFPAVLTSKQVTETILRVERVKGLLCKLLGEGDCIEHFRGVKAMLATLSTPQVHLPHSRVVVNSEWVERELALVDQAEQCRVALAHFKSKDFAKVVQTLSPVLLLGPPVQLDAKRKLQLLEKLYASVKELRGSELGKLFPRVVLLYLSELRARDDSPLTVSASSDMRGILAEVRKMDVSEWSVEDRLKIQCHCASLVAACRGNKQFAGLLANAWETLFFFVERPLTQAGLNLLQMALSTVVEVEACRLNRGSFLRLVISEMLPGIQRFRGDEDPPDEWSWALHQAIQCLFGVRMPNVKKGHKCEVKGEESMLEQLAEVFEYVGSNLQDSGMSNLSRKIYHHFSVLPAQLHTRFADVQAMVFDGAQDDAPPGAVLRLPEKVRDGQNIPHFAVYQEIYALHVVHVLPGKVCKRLHNKSRQVLRSATQRKWFDSKSPEEAKKILLLDLTVNPDRFESWFMLGMLLRATADHRLVMESCLLKDFSADAQKKQSETRAAAMRCFQRSLLCNTSEGNRSRRSRVLALMGLQLVAATRWTEAVDERRALLDAAVELTQKAKEVEPQEWLGWMVSVMVRRKLRMGPALYLDDLSRAISVSKFKLKGALFMQHKLRLKLLLEASADDVELLDVLDARYFRNVSASTSSFAERRLAIASDALAGMSSAAQEEDEHHLAYMKARVMLEIQGDDTTDADMNVQESLKKVFGGDQPEHGSSKLASRLSGASGANASIGGSNCASVTNSIHVRDLEGYGLSEWQVADRISRKMLSVYLNSMDRYRQNHALIFGLFPRLLRQCVAALEEDQPTRALIEELRRCSTLVIDVSESNLAVRSEISLSMLQAVFDVFDAHSSKHAASLFGQDAEDKAESQLKELVLGAARKSLKLDPEPEEERLLETVRLMFRPTVRGAAAAAERVAVDSPNYSLIRKRQRQNPNEEQD